MTYKIIHKLCPESLLEKYESSFSSYNTSNSQNPQIPKQRTEPKHRNEHYKTKLSLLSS